MLEPTAEEIVAKVQYLYKYTPTRVIAEKDISVLIEDDYY
jgi:hypothetical protein